MDQSSVPVTWWQWKLKIDMLDCCISKSQDKNHSFQVYNIDRKSHFLSKLVFFLYGQKTSCCLSKGTSQWFTSVKGYLICSNENWTFVFYMPIHFLTENTVHCWSSSIFEASWYVLGILKETLILVILTYCFCIMTNPLSLKGR